MATEPNTTNKPKLRHILVPTDFSETAMHALDVAVALATKFDAKLTLLHVYYVPPPMYGVAFAWPVDEFASGARQELESALFTLKQRYHNSESALRSGAPGDEIVRAAKDSAADLIVMGTHGRSGLPRLILGSVAERVVRTAPVPVLTVPTREKPTK
jgi:nucleotide-binding universal stress UspA family protein